MSRLAGLALAVLLAVPTAAADGMDAVVAAFAPGRPMSVQLVFDEDAMAHDLCMNATVGEAVMHEGALVVATAPYVVNDLAHRFVVRVREGRLESVELVRREGEGWTAVTPLVFRFELGEVAARSLELDASGQVTLGAWGACNRGRGSSERARALFVVRSFHVEDGTELSY